MEERTVNLELRVNYMTVAHTFSNLKDGNIVSGQADGHAGARPGASREHLGPAPVPGAEPGYVLEVDGEGLGPAGRDEADDDAVAELAGPVRVDLAVDGGGLAGRAEVAGGLAERVLVDVDQPFVLDQGQVGLRDLGQVVAQDDGRLGDGPEAEVGALLGGRELAVADLLEPDKVSHCGQRQRQPAACDQEKRTIMSRSLKPPGPEYWAMLPAAEAMRTTEAQSFQLSLDMRQALP